MEKENHSFVAYSFARGFDMQEILADPSLKPTKVDPKSALTRQLDKGGTVYLYNFGAMTFWNVSLSDRQREIETWRTRYPHSYAEIIVSDDFQVEIEPNSQPRVDFSRLVLDKMTSERAEVIALNLAQSTNMEYYERLLESIRIKVSGLIQGVRTKGRVSMQLSKWYRIIGEAMAMRDEVVGVLHFLDRPDLIWEDRVMDSIYDDLRSVFDLQERFQALTYKLGTIQDSLELLIDMSRDSRLFLVELSIVLLILFEIVVNFIRI